MLESILKLEEVKLLGKVDQQRINGGTVCTYPCSRPEPSPPCICFEWD